MNVLLKLRTNSSANYTDQTENLRSESLLRYSTLLTEGKCGSLHVLVVADDPLHAVLTHFSSPPTGLQYCLCVAPTHLTWYTLLNFEVLFEAGTEMCDTMCEADLDYMQAESGAAQTDSSLSVMAFICHLTE